MSNKWRMQRTGALVIALFFTVVSVLVISNKYERIYLCALECYPENYSAYTLSQHLLDIYSADPENPSCSYTYEELDCDRDEISWIIPVDTIALAILGWGAFVYVQFFYKLEEKPSDG